MSDGNTQQRATPTAGPWRVGGSGDEVWVSPENEDHNVICDMIGRDGAGKVYTPEDFANARLIAAAPELLAAGEAVESLAVKLIRAGGHTNHDASRMATASMFRELVRNAIAKATGEVKL